MAIAATIPPLRLECPNGDIHSEDVWYDAAAIQLAQLSDGIVALLRAVQTHLERDSDIAVMETLQMEPLQRRRLMLLVQARP